MKGYTGKSCEVVCLNECTGRGKCVTPPAYTHYLAQPWGICECNKGWRGPDCTVAPDATPCAVSCADTCVQSCKKTFHHNKVASCTLKANTKEECMQSLVDQVIKPSSACYVSCTENCIRQCGDDASENYDIITGSEYAPRLHNEPIPVKLPAKLSASKLADMVENTAMMEYA